MPGELPDMDFIELWAEAIATSGPISRDRIRNTACKRLQPLRSVIQAVTGK